MARPFPALQELGDTTRLSVFLAILGRRKNVSQIVAELKLAQPQVSYHLRKLKDAGLAVEEKDGRWVWYQANWDAHDRHLRDFIELMHRWAEDDLRSLNGQIEFVLREALRKAGRLAQNAAIAGDGLGQAPLAMRRHRRCSACA